MKTGKYYLFPLEKKIAKFYLLIVLFIYIFTSLACSATNLSVKNSPSFDEKNQKQKLTPSLNLQNNSGQLTLKVADKPLLISPPEGLWSIAQNSTGINDLQYESAHIQQVKQQGLWTIYSGKLAMADGQWLLQDSCKSENDRIKCIRRYEWQGKKTLKNVVLSVRWQVPSSKVKTFLPSLVYYDNPSGKKYTPNNVAHLNSEEGEFVQFEEHRFSMPFSSLEWQEEKRYFGAALHSIPSEIVGANRQDLWWSLGAKIQHQTTELRLLSGPIGFNRQADVAKLYQTQTVPYLNATIDVAPQTIIEKVYYLQGYPVAKQGHGFITPLNASLDIFKPYETEQYPRYEEIVDAKLTFLQTRYIEGEDYAGFNMFDNDFRKKIVMGWAGQSDAPGYFLLNLGNVLQRNDLIQQAQKSLDFLSQANFDHNIGFDVSYNIKLKKWEQHAFKPNFSEADTVSQGQALFMFAKAIQTGRRIKSINTSKWEIFFQKSADHYAKKILAKTWHPKSTNEAFLVAPLALGAELFENDNYKEAAIKAVNHYAKRHLSMNEPYWGGTLDATGEDKEGAWAAFQAFMSVYDLTKNEKYLQWAEHAANVMLSYTVVWNINLPAGRLSDHYFKTTGWTAVSPQNQHLDVYGVLTTPWLYRLGQLTNNEAMQKIARVMYLSCGQLIDIYGSQGEQIQQTNFVQSGHNIHKAIDPHDVTAFRGGYSEEWTVLWITAHFLTAAAMVEEYNIPW